MGCVGPAGLPGSGLRHFDLSLQAPPPQPGRIEARIKDICATRVRYGYRRVHVMLKREGWDINMKRTYWILQEFWPPTQEQDAQAARKGEAAGIGNQRPSAPWPNHRQSARCVPCVPCRARAPARSRSRVARIHAELCKPARRSAPVCDRDGHARFAEPVPRQDAELLRGEVVCDFRVRPLDRDGEQRAGQWPAPPGRWQQHGGKNERIAAKRALRIWTVLSRFISSSWRKARTQSRSTSATVNAHDLRFVRSAANRISRRSASR